MKRIHYLQVGIAVLLLTALLVKLFIIPNIMKDTARSAPASQSINATIYITTDTLAQIFQNRMNQMVNGAFSGFMSNYLRKTVSGPLRWRLLSCSPLPR